MIFPCFAFIHQNNAFPPASISLTCKPHSHVYNSTSLNIKKSSLFSSETGNNIPASSNRLYKFSYTFTTYFPAFLISSFVAPFCCISLKIASASSSLLIKILLVFCSISLNSFATVAKG